MDYPSYHRPPVNRLLLPRAPPPRRIIHLSNLPEKVLQNIISFAVSPPHPTNIVTILSICRPLRNLALPVIYSVFDSDNHTARSLQTLLLLLDRDFDKRCQEYFQQSQPPQPTTITRPSNFYYPLTPANFTPSLAGPQFRLHMQEIRIRCRWDVSQDLRAVWGVRGLPFCVLPVAFDIIRLRIPSLTTLQVDLPKTLRTRATQQVLADTIGLGVINRIARFGNIQTLSFDGWALDGGNIGILISGCSSLAVLNLTRAHVTVSSVEPSLADQTFALRLRRVTITDIILEPMAVPMLLKTCLNLESLHLLGYAYDPTTETDASQLIDCYNPARRRFDNGPPIAPLRTLVLRPSYRTVCGETAFQHFTCLLYALSGTLVNLHFSVQGNAGPFFVSLLSGHVAPKLERLYYGFMWAKDEVGDGVRLSRADDKRMRPGLTRGDKVRGSWDPLEWEAVALDGMVPPLSREEVQLAQRGGGLSNESIVLSRIGVDESLVRALVDPLFQPGWPPNLTAFEYAYKALQPFPPLRALLNDRRPDCLRSVYVFETEYVSSVKRQQQLVQRSRPPYLPGDIGGRGGGSAWERVLLGNFGFNI